MLKKTRLDICWGLLSWHWLSYFIYAPMKSSHSHLIRLALEFAIFLSEFHLSLLISPVFKSFPGEINSVLFFPLWAKSYMTQDGRHSIQDTRTIHNVFCFYMMWKAEVLKLTINSTWVASVMWCVHQKISITLPCTEETWHSDWGKQEACSSLFY